MFIGIHHSINDARKWDQSVRDLTGKIEKGTIPAGTKPVFFIPDTTKKTAFCLWEADSTATIRKFMDDETRGSARNEYFEVDENSAMGLSAAPAGKR